VHIVCVERNSQLHRFEGLFKSTFPCSSQLLQGILFLSHSASWYLQGSAMEAEKTARYKRIIINGPPASGKTTQCRLLAKWLNLALQIEPGHVVRQEINNETPEGLLAKPYTNSGKQLPAEIKADILKKFIQQHDSWVMYRGPGSVEEARTFAEHDIVPQLYITIQMNDDALIERAKYRRVDPVTHIPYNLKVYPPQDEAIRKRLVSRFGDEEQFFRERLRRYHTRLEPVAEFYKHFHEGSEQRVIVAVVDGEESIDGLFSAIEKVILRDENNK